jgi:hypothetical protein
LHALHADEQFGKSSVKGRIIIKCSDTDVLVLCAITIHACRTRINYGYNFATTFLATHIEDSRSGSLSCERSDSSANEDLISL